MCVCVVCVCVGVQAIREISFRCHHANLEWYYHLRMHAWGTDMLFGLSLTHSFRKRALEFGKVCWGFSFRLDTHRV